MYNDQLVYKVVTWAFLEISLWKEKVALRFMIHENEALILRCNVAFKAVTSYD